MNKNQDNSRRTWKKLLPNPWWLLMELALTEPIEDRMMKYFSPPKLDLSNSDLEEFQQREFEGYGPKTNKSVSEDISNEVRESLDALLVEELVLDDKLEKKTAFPTVAKIEFVRPKQQEKPVRKPVKYAEMYRENSLSSQTLKEFEWKDMLPLGEEPKEGKLLLADKSQVLLKVPIKNNMYSVDMKNIVPKESFTCLVAKATLDESMIWHRRLGHVNFKTINKLVKENLVRGLPTKCFENDQTCVACLKGKQQKASYNAPLEATHADFFGDEIEVDMSNITTIYLVPFTPNIRIYKDHSLDHVISDVQSGVQTRRMTKTTNEQGFISVVYEGKTHEDLHTCLFACFLSQEEPKRIAKALSDSAWVEAMQEELLQFKLQKVWVLVDLPKGKRAIGTKWVFRNKKDERGIVIRNKARLVAQGHTQEEGIDYDEVFAPVARIEAIRLFLAYASFMGFMVYQMDVKSAFLYGRIEEEDKYVADILRKFSFIYVRTTSTLMDTEKPLLKDSDGDIDDRIEMFIFTVCAYARFQVTPEVSHLHVVKMIFKYLNGQPKLGLWYLRDSSFDLVAYSDSDYAGASLDRKSTTGGCQFLGCRLISWQCKKQTMVATSSTEAEYVAAASCCGQGPVVQGEGSTHPVESHHTPTSAPSTSQPPISPTSRRTNRQESVVPQPRSPTQSSVADETASTGVDVSYGGAATTVTGLEAGQGSGNIDKTLTVPHDLPLPRVNTLGSDEGSMTLQELMVFCTTLSKKVDRLEIDLKQTKQLYGATYTRLIKKAKKLEKTVKSSQARRRAKIVVSNDEDDLEDPSIQGRKIDEIDQDPGISLVQHDAAIQGRYRHDMDFDFDFDTAKEVSTAEKDVRLTAEPVSTAGAAVTTSSVAVVRTVSPTRRVSTADDITMAKTLVYIRKSAAKDKEERQRIARVHEAASSFNVEQWEDIQARVKADEELAQRAKERRNKPPTQAQQRTYMSNYIKHMGGYTLQQLRGYSFDEIKTLFETTMRKVNTFVPIESEVDRAVPELAVGSSKTDAEEELDQESSKRQKIGESSELAEEPRVKEVDELSQEELQQMMIIVLELGMNVEALQTKYPIIDWEIYTGSTGRSSELEIILRLFEPNTDDKLWKLQKHIHDLTWRLYDSCGVHHVSTKKGIDIYMLVEKEYPLSRGTLTLMLVAKLLVDQDNEMSRELLRKILMQELKVFILSTAKPRVSTAQVTTASTNQLVLLEYASTASTNLRLLKDLRLLNED
ncbi:putative ribonuclease H-like domain-containing protein [Tanacetum coccineum]